MIYIAHLSVRDKSFAEEFARALSQIFSKDVKVLACDEKSDRGIFYKVFLASKEFYNWYYSTNVFEWAIHFPNQFIKGFFDSDGSFNYFKSKGKKYPVVRMVGSDKRFFKQLQMLLKSKCDIKSVFRNRGVQKPTILNSRYAFWKKEVYELGVFNKRDVNTFLMIVEGSNKLKNKVEGSTNGRN